MGINTRHVWAMAMAVALLIVSIGGVMMGMRNSFNSTFGSSQLIFAFEAVIIGGMGSGWGTLLGGVVLGLAQLLGAQAFGPGLAGLGRARGVVVILGLETSRFLAKTVTS